MKLDVSKLPGKPGVYFFKGTKSQTLYVGKALNIKDRIKTHLKNAESDRREKLLVEQSSKVDFIEVSSEIEALILEANLIKKLKPYFNVRLKDDKDYLYIKITKDSYPKILTARKKDLANVKKYFGPYPTSRIVRSTLRVLRRSFPFCSSPPGKNGKLRACFYYHLGLCPGPCIGKITQKDYQKMILRFSRFLSGKKETVLRELNKEMAKRAKSMDFEAASRIRDQIQGIEYLTTQSRSPFLYESNPDLVQTERTAQLKSLQEILNLPVLPKRIECYDISNLYGENATGSMVVLTEAEPDKSQYRRFKIKWVKGINDYAMMKEVIKRRLKNTWSKPDLIVIDGGKGQLGAALEALKEEKVSWPIVSLAKREEEIFSPGNKVSIRLKKDNPALHLVQKIRDEAHRFAVTYHRKLRLKAFIHETTG